MRIKYGRKALIDLEAIARYGEAEWGEDSARSYIANIHRRIITTSDNPFSGSDQSHLRKGYRKVSFGSHLIFYKINADRFEVIRILHERMDAKQQL